MNRYVVSIRVLGRIVMADTEVQADSPAEARKAAEAKFWRDPDDLAAAMEKMDTINRYNAERFLAFIIHTRAEAKRYGITVVARKSRARASS